MADIKIQELTSETSLSDNHLLITQENSDTAETKKTTLSLLKSFLNMLDFSDISQFFAEGTNVNISIDNNTQKITISASTTGEKGDKGDNGFSPIATVEQTETGAVISITDSKGTTTANLTNGINGISPTAKIEQTETGALITIVDSEGTTTANLINGSDGANGIDGTNGVTPHIDEITKHWFIGETDTNVVAQGQDGKDGTTTIQTTSMIYTDSLLVNNWTGDVAPYTQTVVNESITADIVADFGVVLTQDNIETALEEKKQWGYITAINTIDGGIVFNCYEKKPTIQLNYKMRVV